MTAPSPESTESWLRWAVRLFVVVPLAIAAVRAVATGWFPVGDSALLAIRAHDVGTEHHPLLGSWTSASLTLGTNVNNPGPLYSDLLSPFMWTLGRWFGIGTGVAVGVAAVNTAFVAATAWVGTRLGGWGVERWVLLMMAALTWSMGSELLIDIWQPHALLIPFTCLLWLTVALLHGRWTMLPGWLAVVSLIVQTHIGYVYVLGALGVVVAVAGVISLRESSTPMSALVRHRAASWSAAVIVVTWAQPLIEQFFGEGRGNLSRLAGNAGGGDVTIGAGTAVKLVAQVVALPPWWTRFGFEDSVTSTPLTETPDGPQLMVPDLPSGPVALAALAILMGVLVWLTVAVRPRGRSPAEAALVVSLVGIVTAVVSLTIQTVSVVGLGSHHVRWLWVLSLFVQISIVWAAVELGALRLLDRRVTLVVAALTVVLCMANFTFFAHELGPTADREAADTLERTFDDLTTFEPDGAVLYDIDDLRPFEPWSSAVQMRLREIGVEFRVDDEGAVRQLGNRRQADGTEVTTIRQIERGGALDADGPGCVISRASPFESAEEIAIDGLIDDAVADLASGAVLIDVTALEDDLAERFVAAMNGDEQEARILVADGLLPFLEAEGRISTTSPAIVAALDAAELIDRRVVGTLVLVADPPVGCP